MAFQTLKSSAQTALWLVPDDSSKDDGVGPVNSGSAGKPTSLLLALGNRRRERAALPRCVCPGRSPPDPAPSPAPSPAPVPLPVPLPLLLPVPIPLPFLPSVSGARAVQQPRSSRVASLPQIGDSSLECRVCFYLPATSRCYRHQPLRMWLSLLNFNRVEGKRWQVLFSHPGPQCPH